MRFLFILFILCGCASIDCHQTYFDKMDPVQKASIFMTIYSSQYDIYENLINEGYDQELTDEKLNTLTSLYNSITHYNTKVQLGIIPTAEMEDKILQLIEKLTIPDGD